MLYCDKISVVVNVRTIFNSSFPSRAVDYKLGSIKVRSVEEEDIFISAFAFVLT